MGNISEINVAVAEASRLCSIFHYLRHDHRPHPEDVSLGSCPAETIIVIISAEILELLTEVKPSLVTTKPGIQPSMQATRVVWLYNNVRLHNLVLLHFYIEEQIIQLITIYLIY